MKGLDITMVNFRIKERNYGQRTVTWVNPSCGHVQTVNYTTPYICQHHACYEKLTDVEMLSRTRNGAGNRVKYFAEGKI
jgi:hypothetical protein